MRVAISILLEDRYKIRKRGGLWSISFSRTLSLPVFVQTVQTRHMPRPCEICRDPAKLGAAATMLAEGASDAAIAAALGVGRMSVNRHKVGHVIKPLQDQLAIVAKGAAPRQERQELAQAAAADTPTPQAFADAVLGLKAQAEKLERIESRLERMAAAAEAGGSANSVAQLTAQQLRGIEVGAKLASVGGYAPARLAGDGGAAAPVQISINFSGGHSETITVGGFVAADEPDGIEGAAEPYSQPETAPDADTRPPHLRGLVRAFGGR